MKLREFFFGRKAEPEPLPQGVVREWADGILAYRGIVAKAELMEDDALASTDPEAVLVAMRASAALRQRADSLFEAYLRMSSYDSGAVRRIREAAKALVREEDAKDA